MATYEGEGLISVDLAFYLTFWIIFIAHFYICLLAYMEKDIDSCNL